MHYRQIIEENRDLQIQTLQDLVSFESVVSNPATNAEGEYFPFGQGVQDAFAYLMRRAEEFGFETKDVDHYGGSIDFGSGTETVGILGHLDVVPAGEGWDFSPYGGVVSEGYICGRGTLDDKGPVVAALFAMKALKDAGYEPDRKVRLILGLDEETSWKGMKYYFDREPMPDFGFTPDADFPVIYAEKGKFSFEIAKKLPRQQGGLTLRSVTGGSVSNMVPEKARAVVNGNQSQYDKIREMVSYYRKETGYSINVRGIGKSLEITTEGKAAHGASPQDGLNAISILMDFLGKLNFSTDEINVFIDFYNRHIGFEYNGSAIGCGFSDEQTGSLTFNLGLIHLDKESVTLTVDARYPASFTEDGICDAIMPVLNQYDMGLIRLDTKAPVYMKPDSRLIQTLMEVYRENTGDRESRPLVMGGSTYAKAAKNVVAFGGLFPGDPDLMHQKNERISIERFMMMTRIYADAIYRITQKDFLFTEEE